MDKLRTFEEFKNLKINESKSLEKNRIGIFRFLFF